MVFRGSDWADQLSNRASSLTGEQGSSPPAKIICIDDKDQASPNPTKKVCIKADYYLGVGNFFAQENEPSNSESNSKSKKEAESEQGSESKKEAESKKGSDSGEKDGTELFISATKQYSWLAGILGSGGIAVLYLLQQLQKVIGSPKKQLTDYLKSPNYDSHVSFIENFHTDFKKIVTAYAGQGNKVYVFVDDLDRCEVPKSAELMQAINLMISNDPQLVFILGMDREKVAAGLAVKHKEVIPYLSSSVSSSNPGEPTALQGIEYGYTFIEKFVQLPFLVPQPSQADFETFVSKLSVAKQPQDKDRGWQIVWQFFWKPIQNACNRLIQEYENLKSPTATSTPATLPPTENTETPNEPDRQQTQQRLKQFELDYGSDSPAVRNILTMVAPALGWNPRRLKQFLNLFRLRAYVAHATGLLDTVDAPAVRPLTLEQLGKFTAIGLKWTLLKIELAQDSGLLAKLQRYALKGIDTSGNLKSWDGEPELLALLRYGCSDPSMADRYSLEHVEVGKLFQVSPLRYPPIDRIPFRSERGMDYRKLRNYLRAGQWLEADRETARVMRIAADQEQREYLDSDDIKKFPCQDLQIIDQLWGAASKGRFGFSVQKRIWQECGSPEAYNDNWKEFCDRVGWRKDGDWLSYDSFTFDLDNSPVGGLPGEVVGGQAGTGWGDDVSYSLLSRRDLPTVAFNSSSRF